MPKIILDSKKNRFAAPWTLYVGATEDGSRSSPLPKDRYAFIPDEPVELSDAEAKFFLDPANVGGRVFTRVAEPAPPANQGGSGSSQGSSGSKPNEGSGKPGGGSKPQENSTTPPKK